MAELVGSLRKRQSEVLQRTVAVGNSLDSGVSVSSVQILLYDYARKVLSGYASTGTVSGSNITATLKAGTVLLGAGKYTFRLRATLNNTEVMDFDLDTRIVED